jgi:hypothetical protein
MFWFSVPRLFGTLLILRGTCLKMYIGLNVKYPSLMSDFNETWIFSDRFSKNPQDIKFTILWTRLKINWNSTPQFLSKLDLHLAADCSDYPPPPPNLFFISLPILSQSSTRSTTCLDVTVLACVFHQWHKGVEIFLLNFECKKWPNW